MLSCDSSYYVLHSSLIFILLTCSIPVVSMYFQAELKTVLTLIRWLYQKPADLDLQCVFFFKKGINLGSMFITSNTTNSQPTCDSLGKKDNMVR